MLEIAVQKIAALSPFHQLADFLNESLFCSIGYDAEKVADLRKEDMAR
ncbi:hypothetical protein ACFLVD_00900 [Chloroflexota bacterium]